ncbi:MAG: 16S rRNA (guanine(966)-N(2))-methyltransferase RsmD [Candidatus Marinimicrobia bacterium]|nr:16S rRNA (guanine(966)-N(2))-methyltransferase RsmD [Candidatus Neomarinimicrobiota bacterium]|tara:strand:+ start:760 stop:1284 length:525 start_codon:yes stop_codon:yes gene_type:complete
MIKIIAGKYKNRKLKIFNLQNVRPTQARVRKSMMDILRDFSDKEVLDLFSGVGTLGIESYSRGAKHITFVDNNLKVLNVLNKNLELLSINDYSIVQSDAIKFLKNTNQKFDLIFADPPYGKFDFLDLIPFVKENLNINGIFCYECKKKRIDIDLDIKIKNFGTTQVIFWRNNNE